MIFLAINTYKPLKPPGARGITESSHLYGVADMPSPSSRNAVIPTGKRQRLGGGAFPDLGVLNPGGPIPTTIAAQGGL
jgi:hypothetical protein